MSDADAKSFLDQLAQADITSITLDGKHYGNVLATKYDGMSDPNENGGKPEDAVYIANLYKSDQQKFSKVKIVLAGDMGQQSPRLKGHPDAWIIFVDNNFSSNSAASQWCTDNFGTDTGTGCQTIRMAQPYS